MLPDDLAYRRQVEPVSSASRGEERLEDSFPRRLVHAASGVDYRNDRVAPGSEVIMPHPHCALGLARLQHDLDGSCLVHRLRGVVANIENPLLQLRRLSRHDRRLGGLVDHEPDMARQRGLQQRPCFRDERLDANPLSPHRAAPTEGKDLVDEIARTLACAANFTETIGRPAPCFDVGMCHFRKTQDRPDDVVEIVRDTAGESTDGFHPPGLMQARSSRSLSCSRTSRLTALAMASNAMWTRPNSFHR